MSKVIRRLSRITYYLELDGRLYSGTRRIEDAGERISNRIYNNDRQTVNLWRIFRIVIEDIIRIANHK